MKRILIIIFIAAFANGGFSQNKNVNKASRFKDVGRLEEATELIEPAIEHEKTIDKAKTWYTYGEVYYAVLNDSSYEVEDAFKKAVKGYNKAMELEKNESAPFYFYSSQKLEELWGIELNEGVTAYQNGNLDQAIEALNKCKIVKPMDTTAYLYVASLGLEKRNWDMALSNYKTLVEEINYRTPAIYNGYIYAQQQKDANSEATLQLIKDAREVYPGSKDLMLQEINFYISNERTDEARASLEKAIEADPTNHVLFFSLGYLYEESDQQDKAIETYKKAIEVKEDYFEPNFNLGVIYYNKAAKKYSEASNLGISEYKKKGKQIEAEADKLFEDALPYLQKSVDISPEDRTALETLQSVYYRLKMQDKADALQDKIDALN